MVRKIFRLIFSVIGAILGYSLAYLAFDMEFLRIDNQIAMIIIYVIISIIGFLLLYMLSPKLLDKIEEAIEKSEEYLQKIPLIDIGFGALGLLFGLILAFFISAPLNLLKIPVFGDFLGLVLTVTVYFVLGTIGMRLMVKNRPEITAVFTSKADSKMAGKLKKKKKLEDVDQEDLNVRSKPKILDTSVIIDGRIAAICETGFLEGPLIVPGFVLEELQYIADSADDLKRERGRRGLDIVNDLKESDLIETIISNVDYKDIKEVDIKLLKLAKDLNAMVMTNDYNLNKLAVVQDIQVLNVNDLANSVKTVVIPGESMHVNIIKEGKEKRQGLAYLDDGTMIVIEDGKPLIGKDVDVVVTTVLQTAAGKMIFAKPM